MLRLPASGSDGPSCDLAITPLDTGGSSARRGGGPFEFLDLGVESGPPCLLGQEDPLLVGGSCRLPSLARHGRREQQRGHGTQDCHARERFPHDSSCFSQLNGSAIYLVTQDILRTKTVSGSWPPRRFDGRWRF